MNMNYNIFKIYYKIGRALPFEVRRFPRGVQTLWYSSRSVLVTKIIPRGQYGEAWGYYLKDGERSDSYWCSKDINEPQPIPCCGFGGLGLSNNLAEQMMRHFKCTLKNCLNIGSERSAKNVAFYDKEKNKLVIDSFHLSYLVNNDDLYNYCVQTYYQFLQAHPDFLKLIKR